MAAPPSSVEAEVHAYLDRQERKDLLRFITCGSVDDGKSTLIGRLLFESKTLFEDQLAALAADSRKQGTRGGDIDFALLLDGLSAEREQGITIDVAYRFFSTDRRKYIVADTPGHEQYTRNMATGASTADLAIILVDARKGVLTQTRRHSYLVSLLGIKRVVLAVNKMDLMDYSESVARRIEADYREFAAQIGVAGRRLHPDVSGSRRQCLRSQRTHAVVSGPGADGAPGGGAGGRRSRHRSLQDARAVGEPAHTRTIVALPARSHPGLCAWAIRSSPCRPDASVAWPGSSTGLATRRTRAPANR